MIALCNSKLERNCSLDDQRLLKSNSPIQCWPCCGLSRLHSTMLEEITETCESGAPPYRNTGGGGEVSPLVRTWPRFQRGKRLCCFAFWCCYCRGGGGSGGIGYIPLQHRSMKLAKFDTTDFILLRERDMPPPRHVDYLLQNIFDPSMCLLWRRRQFCSSRWWSSFTLRTAVSLTNSRTRTRQRMLTAIFDAAPRLSYVVLLLYAEVKGRHEDQYQK